MRKIAEDIINTGFTAHPKLIASFRQLDNNQEKQRAFKGQLFEEALIAYSSALLVLVEAFSNLDRWQMPANGENMALRQFKTYVDELTGKATLIGLKPRYLPLFKDFTPYALYAKLANDALKPVYQQVTGLGREDVAEIVSYGFDTEFGSTDTFIIFK